MGQLKNEDSLDPTANKNSTLVDLNPAQKAAVLKTDGPLLIVAGPGSGKTRVITHRIAYLVHHHNISPYNILAVTFTNKAAKDMKHRLNTLVEQSTQKLSVSTFHSFCAGLLRREGSHTGLERNFTIYDSEDQLTLIKQTICLLYTSPSPRDRG